MTPAPAGLICPACDAGCDEFLVIRDPRGGLWARCIACEAAHVLLEAGP